MGRNKYNAKAIWCNTKTGDTCSVLPLTAIKSEWLYFPSGLEFKVYDRLKSNPKISLVLTQHTITLCEGITWCVDFLITTKSGNELYIEAKGIETQIYKAKYKLCKALRPEIFANLHIIKTLKQLDNLPL